MRKFVVLIMIVVLTMLTSWLNEPVTAQEGDLVEDQIWTVSIANVNYMPTDPRFIQIRGSHFGPLNRADLEFEGFTPADVSLNADDSQFELQVPLSEELITAISDLSPNESLGITLFFHFSNGNVVTISGKFLENKIDCRRGDICPSGEDFIIFPSFGFADK